MAGYRIQAFNGVRPRDGAPLMLVCDKKKGITVLSIRSSGNKEELSCDPRSACLHKICDGPRSRWTGRALGTWEVDVSYEGGTASFRMKSKAHATGLISWIEKREKKRAKSVAGLGGEACLNTRSWGCVPGDGADVEQYRAYLANLGYRIGYLRGKESVEEVDLELGALVSEIQAVLGGVKDL